MSYVFLDRGKVEQLAQRGDAGAATYLYGEQMREQARGQETSTASTTGAAPPVWPILVLGAGWVIAQLLRASSAGLTWLGTQSWLAPLFPAPGESLFRYFVGTSILLFVVPGGLIALAGILRNGRATWLAVPLVLIAVLLVHVLLWVTQMTTTMAVVPR